MAVMAVRSVATTGSALANLLQTVATCTESFGLLLGTTTSRTVQALQDTAGPQTTQQLEANITAYFACPASLPNTLVAGQPQTDLLQAVHSQLQGESIIGWFAFRQTSHLHPNAVEVNITNSMAIALEGIQVSQKCSQPLFALISSTPQHEGSSQAFQQRLFQANTASLSLDAIELQIRNLGQTGSMEQRYQGVTGSVTLPSIPAFTLTKKHMPSTAGKQSNQTPNQISVSALQCVAMTGLQSQVEAVESMYRKMVRQLETLAHTASVVSPA